MNRLIKISFISILTVTLLSITLSAQSFSDKVIRLKPQKYKLDLSVDYQKSRLNGKCQLTISNPTDQSVKIVPLLLYRLLKVENVYQPNGKTCSFTQKVLSFEDFEKLQVNYIEVVMDEAITPGSSTTITIDYEGYLLGYSETGMSYIKDNIDPQFTIIRPDCRAYPTIGVPCWEVNYKAGLPEFDYEINVTVPDSLVVVNSGILVSKKEEKGLVTYSFKNERPAWRIDIPIAKYGVLTSGTKRIFYLIEDSVRAHKIMNTMSRTIDLYTNWFGPLQNQSTFTLIEIPDNWGSQTTASCIIQAAAAFKNDERLYELYHEISHLWNAPKTDKQPPRWEEGFAMFLQNLTVEKLEKRIVLNQQATKTIQLLKKTFTKYPQYQDIAIKDYGTKEATRLSYRVGMVFFYTLYEIVGEQEFLKIMGSFYQKYCAEGATTEQFIEFVKKNASLDLTKLFREWFYEAKYSQYFLDSLSIKQIVEQYK